MNKENRNLIWFDRPALKYTEAFPIGNGFMGGMYYGGANGRITLNNDTLWSGMGHRKDIPFRKEDIEAARRLIARGCYHDADLLVMSHLAGFYNQSYLPMATVEYKIGNSDELSSYRRSLNLNDAVVSEVFQADGHEVHAEAFASFPDKVICLRFSGLEGDDISFSLNSLLRHSIQTSKDRIELVGKAPSNIEPIYCDSQEPVVYDDKETIRFITTIVVMDTDGAAQTTNSGLSIKNAGFAEIAILSATSYQGFMKPLVKADEDLKAGIDNLIEKIGESGYELVLQRHLSDYRALFSRLDLVLPESNESTLPIDRRLQKKREGSGDEALFALYYQFARYLMIEGSRAGTQALNLQGIWNEEVRPAWSSNYTTNINIEMNYWPVNEMNLAECGGPYYDLLKEISIQGKNTAREEFHCQGWCANHNVDLWRQTGAVRGLTRFAFWPFGGVWMTNQMCDYFRYHEDPQLLADFYPILKGAVEFCMSWQFKGDDGLYHTSPSTNPENDFLDEQGRPCGCSWSTTADIALIRELYTEFIGIAKSCGHDPDLVSDVEQRLKNMPEFRIHDGRIQEWILPFPEGEVGHRHFSPLMGVFPFHLIRSDNKIMMKACEAFLRRRLENGSGQQGWSCAWSLILLSRFRMRDEAYNQLRRLLLHCTYNNLLDLHPPLGEGFPGEKEVFQIDGNFGGAKGIMSLLLDTENGVTYLLPCLPDAWDEGSVSGVVIEGGFVLGMKWARNKLVSIELESLYGNTVRLSYPSRMTVRNAEIASDRADILSFDTVRGRSYTIVLD